MRKTAAEQFKTLLEYVNSKLETRDWHAVRDGVVDIEILLAKYPKFAATLEEKNEAAPSIS